MINERVQGCIADTLTSFVRYLAIELNINCNRKIAEVIF